MCPEAVNNLTLWILMLCRGNEAGSGKRDTPAAGLGVGIRGPQSIKSCGIRVAPHRVSFMILFILGINKVLWMLSISHPWKLAGGAGSPLPLLFGVLLKEQQNPSLLSAWVKPISPAHT